MNRHERRAAAARARRPGYMHRIAAAFAGGALPRAGVVYAAIEHDASCGIYRGAGCTCVPDISIAGPDAVTVVDADGTVRKTARS